jgi:hypothetical protein
MMREELFDYLVDEIIPQVLFHVGREDRDEKTDAKLDEILLLRILNENKELLSVRPLSWFVDRFIKSEEKLKIQLNEFSHTCGDGCCDNYGTNVYVNGVEMPFINQDTGTIVKQILEYLGHNVEIIETFNGEI